MCNRELAPLLALTGELGLQSVSRSIRWRRCWRHCRMNSAALLVALAVGLGCCSAEENVVTVTVYFDSFCQDCADFITEQLYPTYLAIGLNRMKVELVPYGNTKRTPVTSSTWSLTCTQGPKECLTNKLQACGVHVFSNYSRVCFVRCTMFSPYAGPQCVTALNSKEVTDDTDLANCVNSVQGDVLLDENGRKTFDLQVPLTSLPVVTFDGEYSEDEQQVARTNLLKLVCSRLRRFSAPAVCEEARANQTMTHRNFDTEYVYPHSNLRCSWSS